MDWFQIISLGMDNCNLCIVIVTDCLRQALYSTLGLLASTDKNAQINMCISLCTSDCVYVVHMYFWLEEQLPR